jgi:transposase
MRTEIGEEVSEQLEYVPSSLHVIVHARFRYARRACREHVAIADKPPQPINKGLPGPGLMAHMATIKDSEHLPLCRQEDTRARHRVALPRGTLCGWMARADERLEPRRDLMAERVRSSTVIWTDDYPVPVWGPMLPGTRTGRSWVYAGDRRNPYTIYDPIPSSVSQACYPMPGSRPIPSPDGRSRRNGPASLDGSRTPLVWTISNAYRQLTIAATVRPFDH